MKIPLQEKGPQALVDEYGRSTEFSKHEELYKSREIFKPNELFTSRELPEPKKQSPVSKKKQTQEKQVKLLTQYVAGITAVTVTAGAILLSPSFKIQEETIGLTAYQCVLSAKNIEDLTLQAILTMPGGEIISETPLNADMGISFTDLYPETAYEILIQDEQGKTHFTYPFTTDPFFTFTDSGESGSMGFTLHEDIPMVGDMAFFLYDEEGKSFRDNVYYVVLDDGLGGTDSEWDSTSDTSNVEMELAYYLLLDGLYAGEYYFQLVSYPPDTDTELVYEKKLTLGTLTPLSYTPTVDVGAGQISLAYQAGDLGPYESLTVEFYQGEEYAGYVDTADIIFNEDGSMQFAIPADIQAGTYTLYLIGHHLPDGNYIYNQIFKCEIVI